MSHVEAGMEALSTLGASIVGALALEGLLAIARRFGLVSERRVAGEVLISILRLGLAQAARGIVVEYAGPSLGDWSSICGWVTFSLVWVAALRIQTAIVSGFCGQDGIRLS